MAVALPDANIDTDIIFPARFLLITEKKGLGKYAFYEHRHRADGSAIAGSPFDDPALVGASILIAGMNFGCGSSREQAVWALHDLGFRSVVSSGFGEIFAANCYANGILPIVVPPDTLNELLAVASAGSAFTVDLDGQSIIGSGHGAVSFAVPAWRKTALLNGWDEIDGILKRHAAGIAAFETGQRAARPWLYMGEDA